ncbi:MAG: single-stranded DNA-binding protein [Desulfovibrio sp.]|uniref:single-stranded DNA-binding protein n=1 Tax=Desulfovibrio sp. TaxID=885 RepID=UPI00135E9C30|nr:single-stranded DNA-binding protein [Desulfovibrio sp.]MTJ93914.1 single-stranded DNA-binding protein [Desulfovibrio sp.]
MAGVNKVILIGNLGRDPEVRHAQDGSKIVSLNVATSETWKDRGSGERREKTEWHRVVVFNDRVADVAERYLKKGSKVYIEGSLQTRKWTDQSGAEKFVTEVVIGKYKGELTLLDGRGDGGSSVNYPPPAGSEADYGRQSGGSAPAARSGSGWEAPSELNDDIPFARGVDHFDRPVRDGI